MPLFPNLLRHRKVQQVVTGSLQVSAALPDSNNASLNNSTGASAASAQFVPYLYNCLNPSDSGDEFESQIQNFERSMGQKVGVYANAGLPRGVGSHWQPEAKVLDLVHVAIRCSKNVYQDYAPEPTLAGFNFETHNFIPGSFNGVSKSANISRVTSTSRVNEDFPALVIAIRGTQPKVLVDWLVNFNHDDRESTDFINLRNLTVLSQLLNLIPNITVHSGFLNTAKAMLQDIRRQIGTSIASGLIKHVVFTGHSAGGAVASLLFLHLLGVAAADYPTLRFSLITFGSAPVTSPSLTPFLQQCLRGQPRPGIALAFVNEHDLVAKADQGYIQSMMELFVNTGRNESHLERWPLPSPDLFLVGDIIVLYDRNIDTEDEDIQAIHLTPQQLAPLLFCERVMHQMGRYEKNIEHLRVTLPAFNFI